MKRTITVLIVTLSLTACGGGPPTPRMAAACAAVDGNAYVLGGIPKSGRMTNVVEQYAPGQALWTRKREMPTARGAAATAVLGGRIYLFGGRNESGILDIVESYDVASDTWATEARMPSAVWYSMAAGVGDRIYIFGGLVGTGDQRKSIDAVNI